MNDSALTVLLSVLDDAIGLAEDAVKTANAQPKAPEPIELRKVAGAPVTKERAKSAAETLMNTGAFGGETTESLTKIISTTGTPGVLVLLEKLASKAVFAMDVPATSMGDLVEKSAADRTHGDSSSETSTDLWTRCCSEAGIEVSAG